MRWSRAFPMFLVVGAISLLLSLSLASAQSGYGTVSISDGVANSDLATISIPRVAELPPDEVYEGWFISDVDPRIEKLSTGILAVDENGSVNQTFTIALPGEGGSLTPLGANLFGAFHQFVVTIEPAEDTDPGPSDKIYLVGAITENVNAIRQLNFANPGSAAYTEGIHAGTPKGAAVGLREQTGKVAAHAQMALSYINAGNTTEALAHAQIAVNIINGGAGDGDNYGAMTYAADVASIAGELGDLGANAAASAMEVSAKLQGIVDTVNQASSAVSAGSDTAARSFIHSAANQGADASDAAYGTYMAAQAVGEYNLGIPPAAPPVGDPTVPQLAMASLIAGMVLLAFGGLVVLRNRRSRATA